MSKSKKLSVYEMSEIRKWIMYVVPMIVGSELIRSGITTAYKGVSGYIKDKKEQKKLLEEIHNDYGCPELRGKSKSYKKAIDRRNEYEVGKELAERTCKIYKMYSSDKWDLVQSAFKLHGGVWEDHYYYLEATCIYDSNRYLISVVV